MYHAIHLHYKARKGRNPDVIKCELAFRYTEHAIGSYVAIMRKILRGQKGMISTKHDIVKLNTAYIVAQLRKLDTSWFDRFNNPFIQNSFDAGEITGNEMDLKNLSFDDDGAPEPAELPENSGIINHAVAAILGDKLFASKPEFEVVPPLPTLRSLLNKSDAGDMSMFAEDEVITDDEVTIVEHWGARSSSAPSRRGDQRLYEHPTSISCLMFHFIYIII